MAVSAQRRFARDDDEDNGPYDKRYPGQRVIADGGRVRVPVTLTDAEPPRRAVYDASAHRPHYAVVDASDPNVRAAERAYHEHNARICDAWKTPSGAMAQAPDNGADEPDEDDDGEPLSERDKYIQRTSNAWRQRGPNLWATPGPTMMGPQASPGNPRRGNGASSRADANQREYIAQLSPGAKPGYGGGGRSPSGVTHGQHNPRAFPSGDAASLRDAKRDADQAYGEYCARISNAWKT